MAHRSHRLTQMGPHHLVLSSEVLDVDGCSHPEAAQFSPETGDLIACGSAVNKRDRLSRSVSASLRSLRSLRFVGMDEWIWVYLGDLWAVLDGRVLSAVFPGRGISAHLFDLSVKEGGWMDLVSWWFKSGRTSEKPVSGSEFGWKVFARVGLVEIGDTPGGFLSRRRNHLGNNDLHCI